MYFYDDTVYLQAVHSQTVSTCYKIPFDLTPVIDREIFFGNPEIINGQLSPDGRHLAFIKPYQGVRNIWVKGTADSFEEARPVTADTVRPIPNYFWSHDSKYLLYVQDKGGNEDYHVYALDPFLQDGKEGIPEARNLTPIDGVRAVIYNVPETAPDKIFVGLNERDKSWHDLYEVQISTGEKTLLFENRKEINNWVFDLQGQLRVVERSTKDGGTEFLLVQGTDLRSFYTCSFEESGYVVRFHKDHRRFFMATNKGKENDLTKLVLFDTDTLTEEFVEADPEGQVDFGGAFFSRLTDELIATTYNGDKPRKYFKNAAFEDDYNFLKNQLPGVEINFGSSTKDETKWLIYATSDTDPGATYLFDRVNRTLDFQYRPRPNLPVEHLTKMEPVRYPSYDELEVSAYLSLPKEMPSEDLPAILLIHGGPWARDSWGYDAFAQFLANRGYAVLQPNFRGSTGYGKKFLNAANGEWGRAMQDDITAGVDYLVRRGIADPARIGIMGGSYGGYATLAGLTFTPDVYAAGVSIVGPSNLLTLLDSIPAYWETIREMFYKRMGNPNTEEGVNQLKDQSPLFHAEKIKVPLLVVQGANDPRVKQAESDQIVIAMRNLGLPVEYLVAPDEGHGFARPENNMAFIAAMEKFLARHLGGRYQEDMPEPISKRLEEIRVDINTVKLAEPIDESSIEKDYPIFENSLAPGQFQYRMTVTMGDQNLPIDLTRTVIEEKDQWVVMERGESLMGNIEDRVVLDKASLKPLEQSIVQGPVNIRIEYGDQRITGEMGMNNNKQAFTVDLENPTLGAGLAKNILLPSLPLTAGYKRILTAFDPQSQKTESFQIEVLGAEKIQTEAGDFDAIKLSNTSLHGQSESGYLWVSVSTPRFLIRSESTVPQMGGAKVVYELAKVE